MDIFYYSPRSVSIRNLYYHRTSPDIIAAVDMVPDDPHNIRVVVFEPTRADPVKVSRLYYYRSDPEDSLVAQIIPGPGNPHFIGQFSNYVFNLIVNDSSDRSSAAPMVVGLTDVNPHFVARHWLPMQVG